MGAIKLNQQVFVNDDSANILNAPQNGGAKVLYQAKRDQFLGSATGNTFKDNGSVFIQFTEDPTKGDHLGVADRIVYVDIDSVRWENALVDQPMNNDPIDGDGTPEDTSGETSSKTGSDGSKTVTVIQPDGSKTITVTDASGNQTVTHYDADTGKAIQTTTDPVTGKKQSQVVPGALSATESAVPKALTYAIYGLIGLSVVAVIVILVKLLAKPKPGKAAN